MDEKADNSMLLARLKSFRSDFAREMERAPSKLGVIAAKLTAVDRINKMQRAAHGEAGSPATEQDQIKRRSACFDAQLSEVAQKRGLRAAGIEPSAKIGEASPNNTLREN